VRVRPRCFDRCNLPSANAPVDLDFGCDIGEFTSLPRLNLFVHGLEVALRAIDTNRKCNRSLQSQGSIEKHDAPFPAGREAVRMFLRGSFPCVFFLAIGADRAGQYGGSVRNLLAVY